MYNFFEDKFEQINKLKYLMTLAGNDRNSKIYRDKIENIFDEFEIDNERTEDKKENKDMLILTKEEVAEFNGKNGKPSYIIIDDIIYDVSNIDLFKQSPHNELKLGQDLTKDFYECHEGNMKILDKIPRVGLLAESDEVEFMEEVEAYYPEKRFKIMSSEELKKYNGESGNLAYVAINDMVYDVTNAQFLKVSPHEKLPLGSNITKEFNECHKGNKDILNGIPIVAVLYDFNESKRGQHIECINRDLTLSDLSKYNGTNGNKAYIALDGVIYDVTNVDIFKKSPHNALKLGSDVTKEFNECHNGDKSILVRLPIVGSLIYDKMVFAERDNMKEFNINELSNYDGKNGNPPYIAIFGTVYDLTDLDNWEDRNIKVGCDLTGEYKELYGNDKSPLENLTVVGVLTCSFKEC